MRTESVCGKISNVRCFITNLLYARICGKYTQMCMYVCETLLKGNGDDKKRNFKVCACVSVDVCTHTYQYVYVICVYFVCTIHVCKRICIYICICICIYIHIMISGKS